MGCNSFGGIGSSQSNWSSSKGACKPSKIWLQKSWLSKVWLKPNLVSVRWQCRLKSDSETTPSAACGQYSPEIYNNRSCFDLFEAAAMILKTSGSKAWYTHSGSYWSPRQAPVCWSRRAVSRERSIQYRSRSAGIFDRERLSRGGLAANPALQAFAQRRAEVPEKCRTGCQIVG